MCSNWRWKDGRCNAHHTPRNLEEHPYPIPIDEPDATDFVVMADDFKVVYIAPMKALAAEVTDKLGKETCLARDPSSRVDRRYATDQERDRCDSDHRHHS